jgi:hypothetical protein
MVSRTGLLVIALVSVGVPEAEAQDRERKRATAVRVPDGVVRMDGRLDEAVWRQASPLAGFTQKEPVEGEPATDNIDVRFVYDGGALYVGARMASSAPIQAPLGRRDDVDQAEHILVSLDTYLDRRTASTFGVTANGARLDHYYASDNDFDDDDTFTPVWQAQTVVDERGWTAELRIPFSQLRFNRRSPQIWGLNVRRWIPSLNEEVFWSPVRRTDERWASLFGDLHGIDVQPRQRVELLPYVTSNARLIGNRDAADPLNARADLGAATGADAKLGIGSNLTLEATVNPDFGQVEADPAQVNLSAFEIFFEERRPFFLEGANLLVGNVEEYFYSRRIGAPPPGQPMGEFVQVPRTTTILGAGKLTGRLASGMSVGMLSAVTAEESARAFTGGTIANVRVAPRTFYNVTRVEQQIGQQASSVALMATAVHRQLDASDPLSAQLTRNAFTFSGDSVLRFGDHEVQSFMGVTYADGEPGAILRLQRSSARFYQRPDVTYVQVDPTRRQLTGAKGGISIERQNARHWLWEAATSFTTPGFETNDIGRLNRADNVVLSSELEYQETTPGRWLRGYSFSVGQEHEWNFGGDLQTSAIGSEIGVTLPNFLEAELNTVYQFRRQDMRLTRGGPSMQRPATWSTTLTVESREGAQTQGNLDATYGGNEDGGLTFSLAPRFSVRPASQWQLSVSPSYVREVDTQQYVATLPGGPPETYGGRYIFGQLDRSTYSMQARVNYTFKPDLNLDFYGEPFVASGRYDSVGQLAAARGRELLPITTDLLPLGDFRVRSFRSNLVLRWEWRPGSFFYVVWQQNRAEEEATSERATIGDMFRSLGARGDNFFAVKMSVWLSR